MLSSIINIQLPTSVLVSDDLTPPFFDVSSRSRSFLWSSLLLLFILLLFLLILGDSRNYMLPIRVTFSAKRIAKQILVIAKLNERLLN